MSGNEGKELASSIKEDIGISPIPEVTDKSKKEMLLAQKEEKKKKKQEDKLNENMNIRAAIVHLMGDMVQSLGVIAAAIIIKVRPDW